MMPMAASRGMPKNAITVPQGCNGHADAASPSLQDDTVVARYGVDKQSTGGNHHRNLADA